MNGGAYGCYPKKYRSVKRYGKRVSKRPSKNMSYNQYTFKKTRVGRLTKTNMQSVPCTYSTQVGLGNDAHYSFVGGLLTYLNLATVLTNSAEFISRQAQYSYYMITGMSVTFTRRWADPITYGVDSVSSGITIGTYQGGMDSLDVNFYPNLLSTAVGQSTQDADSSFRVSPFIHGKQRHYQPFPKNLSVGNNAQGLGVWNTTNNYGNINGLLSIYNPGLGFIAATGSPQYLVWDIEIEVYISFCNNTGI